MVTKKVEKALNEQISKAEKQAELKVKLLPEYERLQEIPGIGPSRKRALLHHFGTLKEIERASIADLGKVPGVSAESARKIFEFFHARPG